MPAACAKPARCWQACKTTKSDEGRCAALQRKALNGGEILYREGDAPGDAYIVLSGEIAMERRGVTVVAGEGAVVGLSGLVLRPYATTAVAAMDSVVLAFTRREMRALMVSDPDRALMIVEAIINLLGQVNAAADAKLDL